MIFVRPSHQSYHIIWTGHISVYVHCVLLECKKLPPNATGHVHVSLDDVRDQQFELEL